MSDEVPSRSAAAPDADRLARLEARLARLEAHLGFGANVEGEAESATRPAPASAKTVDELEFEFGQSWFAMAGIGVLTIGAGFLLSLPFADWPAAAPAAAGLTVAIALLGTVHFLRGAPAALGNAVHGAAMLLLLFATLRAFFPSTRPALALDSIAGRAVLLAMVAVNFAVALQRRSPWLTGLALATAGAAAVTTSAAWLALPLLLATVGVTMAACRRHDWPVLKIAAAPVAYAAYVLWALGNPLRGGAVRFVSEPLAAPLCVLGLVVVLTVAPLLRPREEREGARAGVGSLLACGLGYGVFLVHTFVAFRERLAPLHTAAFAVFLGLAVAFWVRQRSRVATFFYAMTGYAALSAAIFKAAAVPAVFVWLSVQSVVVVATAIWFRSRFIVVANFLIYVLIVLGYMVVAEHETGISLGFGVVALVSARILNWQRERLELKTELMRNAYLVGAFLVFPYALYHLVPGRHVGLAWVALALGYYALNVLVQNQKYRWMGHATLLLTTIYLVVVGTRRFEPVYRVLSFLVLGTVLLIVSVMFARLRKRAAGTAERSTLNA